MRLFPEAKVILTTRKDEEKWLQSAMSLVESMYLWPAVLLRGVIEPLKGELSKGHEVSRPATSMQKLFMAYFRATNRAQLEPNLLPTYRRHNAFIRELMKSQPDRYLEYKLESGWEPLRKFLG